MNQALWLVNACSFRIVWVCVWHRNCSSSPQEADLVTTHELGHNFGAEHDPDKPECAPREDQGGKYVMYPIAVSGDHVNNKVQNAESRISVFKLTVPPACLLAPLYTLIMSWSDSEPLQNYGLCLPLVCFQMFSDCSKRSIVKRLRLKAPSCFKERKINVCGNSRVEQGEECDPGLLHINSDLCCTPNCRLKANAQCRSEIHLTGEVILLRRCSRLTPAVCVQWQEQRLLQGVQVRGQRSGLSGAHRCHL